MSRKHHAYMPKQQPGDHHTVMYHTNVNTIVIAVPVLSDAKHLCWILNQCPSIDIRENNDNTTSEVEGARTLPTA
jgi:hypothetical protein